MHKIALWNMRGVEKMHFHSTGIAHEGKPGNDISSFRHEMGIKGIHAVRSIK